MKISKKRRVKIATKLARDLTAHGVPKAVVPKKSPIKTRKAGAPNQVRDPRLVHAEQVRHYILDYTLDGYSQYDIGMALGITQTRVSQLLKQILEEAKKQRMELADKVLDREIARCMRVMRAWAGASQNTKDPRAAEVMLKWTERMHKLLGLDVSKSELTGRDGGPIRLAPADLSALSDEELKLYEELTKKVTKALPAPETAE